MFNINDKIVCVNATMDAEDAACFSAALVEGRIYAVRGVDPEPAADGFVGLYLVGITGQVNAWGEEYNFCCSRFRKLGESRAVEEQQSCEGCRLHAQLMADLGLPEAAMKCDHLFPNTP